MFISDPGSDVAGEDVPLDKSDCDEPEDEDGGEDSGKKLLRILTTSSNTSSSHKLSLSPSEARMRISSCSMGSVNVRAWVEGLDGESGPSWTGVLKLHHISSLRHTMSSPLTNIPIQSPKCAIFKTAPLPRCVSFSESRWSAGGDLSAVLVWDGED